MMHRCPDRPAGAAASCSRLRRPVRQAIGVVLLLLPALVPATTVHCVATSAQLAQALADAVADDGDDEIRILVGTYIAPATSPGGFRYVSSRPGNLVLSGGWKSDDPLGLPSCDSQISMPSLTVLDGKRQAQVLVIQPGATSGDIFVRNLTVTRGTATNNGGGIVVDPWDPVWAGNLGIQSLRILANEAANEGAGLFALLPSGYLRMENTAIAGNVSGGGIGAGISVIAHGDASLFANITVAGNSSGSAFGAGMRLGGTAAMLVQNSVFHDNAPFGLQLAATAVRLRHNHISGLTGQTPLEDTATQSGSPMLGAGSLGLTPLPGSDLIDRGEAVPGGLPLRDADGGQRITGAAVDLGAFESQVFADGYEGPEDWERPPPVIPN